MGQIHNVYERGAYNPATKQKQPDVLVAQYKVSRVRKHGRDRRFGRITRITKLELKEQA